MTSVIYFIRVSKTIQQNIKTDKYRTLKNTKFTKYLIEYLQLTLKALEIDVMIILNVKASGFKMTLNISTRFLNC